MTNALRKSLLWIFALLLLVAVIFILISAGTAKPSAPLAVVPIADGRNIVVRAVAFGTDHHLGHRSMITDHLSPWMPTPMRDFFSARDPYTDFKRSSPSLVIWVEASKTATGQPVDCQAIRVELVDGKGQLFGTETRYWYGISSNNIGREAHVFSIFPRDETKLILQITPWKTNVSSRVELDNPFVVHPARWTGNDLPQTNQVGDIKITIAKLDLRTNGATRKYWETPTAYWAPNWKLQRAGKPLTEWAKPNWTAEDPLGNQGQYLGTNHPVLRFTGTFYPEATNLQDAQLVARLPLVTLTNISTNIVWWNSSTNVEGGNVTALGWFPKNPMAYVFSEGQYMTNPPSPMAPTRGGAPSGWVSSELRISPIKVQEWNGHYSPGPVIYLRLSDPQSTNHIAVRLHDDQGRWWTAKPEPEGDADGIMPYLVSLPPEVQSVTPEIVLLKPVRAEFMVNIPPPGN